jgi:hypothetical protein
LDSGGRVLRFAFLGCTVDFDELSELAAILQRVRDRGAVRHEAVRCDLKPLAGSRQPQTFDEGVRGVLIALPHGDAERQFGIALNCHKHVAVTKVRIVGGPDTLLFFLDETPQFVALNVLRRYVSDFLGHDALALLASEHQELQNRGVVNVRDQLHARHAVTFEQHSYNHLGLLDR